MPTASPMTVKAPAISAGVFGAPDVDLAFSLVAALHRHPHLSNVLTHISRASWPRVEHTLRLLIDPATGARDLTPLALNMLDLICAERGDTGRIFKPYFRALLTALAGPSQADQLLAHMHRLRTSGPVPIAVATASPAGARLHA